MKNVYYIGWYISENDKSIYSGNVPGNLKMHYIADKIVEAGHQLTILSLADKNNHIVYGARKKELENKTNLRYFGGISKSTKLGRFLNTQLKLSALFFYVIFCINAQDTIIIYHSELYTRLLAFVKKICKRKVICEVEEIYGFSAVGDDWDAVNREFSSIRKLDSFLLINDYLQEELNIAQDNYVPCYGVVNIASRERCRIDDGFIHVVYAGTIEGRKQGAYQAVEAAEFLPKNYKLHIIGFGKEEHIQSMKEKITEVNAKQGYEMVVYEGFKSGNDLDQYLYSCHIGISTYVMRDTFANNSLPSKIFTYMCHDLAVVRGFAPAYENTEIAKNWTFYYSDTAKDIASAIVEAKIPEIGENILFLKQCDENIVNFLRKKC